MKTINYVGHTALFLNIILLLRSRSCLLTLKNEILNLLISLLWLLYSFYTEDIASTIFYTFFIIFNIKDLCSVLEKRRNESRLF